MKGGRVVARKICRQRASSRADGLPTRQVRERRRGERQEPSADVPASPRPAAARAVCRAGQNEMPISRETSKVLRPAQRSKYPPTGCRRERAGLAHPPTTSIPILLLGPRYLFQRRFRGLSDLIGATLRKSKPPVARASQRRASALRSSAILRGERLRPVGTVDRLRT